MKLTYTDLTTNKAHRSACGFTVSGKFPDYDLWGMYFVLLADNVQMFHANARSHITMSYGLHSQMTDS